MAPLCSYQGTLVAVPAFGHATARWEGFEPLSPGLEPGILAGWTTTARAGASAPLARTNRVGSARRPFALAARHAPTPLTAARRSRFLVSWCRSCEQGCDRNPYASTHLDHRYVA